MEASEAARQISKTMFHENFSKLILPDGEHMSEEADIMLQKIGREWLMELTMEAVNTAKRNGSGSVTDRDVDVAAECMFGGDGAVNGKMIEKPPVKQAQPSQRYEGILRMIDDYRNQK